MRRQVHSVVPHFDNVHMDVWVIVYLMANSTLSVEFELVEAPDKARAVRRWLAADDDVDAVLSGADEAI